MKPAVLIVIGLPFLLAACDRREVASICAASGEPGGEVTAAFHDAEGNLRVLRADAGAGRAMAVTATLDPPVLEPLWRVAETSMRSLRETEASPCGFATEAAVHVTFTDGTSIVRQTTCTGNALDRVASEVLAAAEVERRLESAPSVPFEPLSAITDACERI